MVTPHAVRKSRRLAGWGWISLLLLAGCEAPVSVAPPAMPTDEPIAVIGPVSPTEIKPKFEVEFLSWNLESEGSKPAVIAQQLADMKRFDVYALSEVMPSARAIIEMALGKNYATVVSESGFNDRLAIVYDETKFEKIKQFEIQEINFKHRYRAPLVLVLKDKATDIKFAVMNNHLARKGGRASAAGDAIGRMGAYPVNTSGGAGRLQLRLCL